MLVQRYLSWATEPFAERASVQIYWNSWDIFRAPLRILWRRSCSWLFTIWKDEYPGVAFFLEFWVDMMESWWSGWGSDVFCVMREHCWNDSIVFFDVIFKFSDFCCESWFEMVIYCIFKEIMQLYEIKNGKECLYIVLLRGPFFNRKCRNMKMYFFCFSVAS